MAVTNPYYEFDPTFTAGSKVRAGEVNTQLQAIQNAFDLLPGDSADATTRGVATFAGVSTGASNAYEVTMPDTRTSNKDGDVVVFEADKTNTGAATLNVDSIGAATLADWDGTALTGGEIVTGRYYQCRYDITNTRFVIDGNTDASVKVGYAEEWAIRAEDDPIPVAAGGNGTNEYSAYHWAEKARLNAVDLSALRWEQKTASYTMVNGDRLTVEATGATATIRPPTTLVLGDFYQVHNETTSTQTVQINPQSGQTIRGGGTTVTSADNLVLAPGETAFMVASSTTELEMV